MTATLIIAAHGARNDPSINDAVNRLARSIRDSDRFADVLTAFHQGEPSFASVLDQAQTSEVIVVPLMTSDGYYRDVVLARELARHPKFATLNVHITSPVGTHPSIVDLVANRVATLMSAYHLATTETAVAIIGHGTPRHHRSRAATEELASQLAALGLAAKTLVAFLDEDPPVQSLQPLVRDHHLVIVPFLISDGYHVRHDIPERLGLSGDDSTPPLANGVRVAIERRGLWTIVDRAVGTDPRIEEIILDVATQSVPRPKESGHRVVAGTP